MQLHRSTVVRVAINEILLTLIKPLKTYFIYKGLKFGVTYKRNNCIIYLNILGGTSGFYLFISCFTRVGFGTVQRIS